MPVITNFEEKVLSLIKQNQYQWFTVGVNLGGNAGQDGGSGITLGGFTGQLIQSKVAYDTTEAISLFVPNSGQSLVHNLNRVRYWINQRGLPLVVQDEGVTVASGVTIIDFIGAPVTVTYSGGKIRVTISGTGAGGGDTVKITSADTVANYLDNKLIVTSPVTKTKNNPGGNENLEIGFNGSIDAMNDVTIVTAVSGEVLSFTNQWRNLSLAGAKIAHSGHLHSGVYAPSGHTHTQSQITDLVHDAVKIQGRDVTATTPTSGQALRWNGTQWIPSGIASLVVQKDDITVVSGVTAINFEGGATVINESNSKVTVIISGGGGGGNLDGLSDVVITGPIADKEVLAYNTGTVSWINQTQVEAGLDNALKIRGISVVSWPPTLSGQVLVYDGSVYAPGFVSGGGGGGSLTVKDEGITVLSAATALNFKGSQITATASGSTANITVSGVIVNVPPFKGVRVHLKSNWLLDNDSWTTIGPYGAQSDTSVQEFDQGNFYREDGSPDWWRSGLYIPEDGYYHIYGQVTTLTSYSGSGQSMTAGLWKNDFYTFMCFDLEGPRPSSGTPYVFRFATDAYLTKADPDISDWDDNISMKVIRSTGAPNIVIASGYHKTFIGIHKIQPTVTVTQESLVVTSATRVYRDVDASNLLNSNGSWTNIPFTSENADPAIGYDTNNYWSVGDDTKFYFPTTGYYAINAQVTFEQNDQGVRYMRILKNGASELARGVVVPISNTTKAERLITDGYFAQNNYIQIQAAVSGGASPNRTIKGTGQGYFTFVTISRIGMP